MNVVMMGMIELIPMMRARWMRCFGMVVTDLIHDPVRKKEVRT